MNLSRLQELSGLRPATAPIAEATEPKKNFHAIQDFVNDSLSDLEDALGTGGSLSALESSPAVASLAKALAKALAAFKKQVEKVMTDIEVNMMADEATVKKGLTPSKLTEAKDYSDSGEFTDDLFTITDHINKIKQSIRQPRWTNWMQVTDDNFSTSCIALNKDVTEKVNELDIAFDALDNEFNSVN